MKKLFNISKNLPKVNLNVNYFIIRNPKFFGTSGQGNPNSNPNSNSNTNTNDIDDSNLNTCNTEYGKEDAEGSTNNSNSKGLSGATGIGEPNPGYQGNAGSKRAFTDLGTNSAGTAKEKELDPNNKKQY
jgi:hypothetical protein